MAHAHQKFLCVHEQLCSPRIDTRSKCFTLHEAPHRTAHLRLLLTTTPAPWLHTLVQAMPAEWIAECFTQQLCDPDRPLHTAHPRASVDPRTKPSAQVVRLGAHVEYSTVSAEIVDRLCDITVDPSRLATLCETAAKNKITGCIQ